MTKRTRTKFDLLLAPSADRLGKIGKKELVQAFQDEGIVDIETLVARIVEVAHESTERLSKELKPINIDLAARRTLPDIAKKTYHVAPEVPVIVDGIEYDPKDIRRFDGEALHFVLVNGHKDSKYLHALRDEAKPIIATYLYTRHVASIVTPLDWPPSSGWPPPPPVWGDGGRCGWMGAQNCLNQPDPPKPPPHTPGQIQMFDDADFSGNWFWLPSGYYWDDLTRVSGGGIFSTDWNDEISSLSTTTTTCWYHEHIHLQGSTLIVRTEGIGGIRTPANDPTQVLWTAPISNLGQLGWDDRISSVINWWD